MEIDINQKAISIGDKYNIFVDGKEEYFASVSLFNLLPEIKLFKNKETEPVRSIKKELTALKASFTITSQNDSILKFTTISILRCQFQCICVGDVYEVFENKGRRFSVYKNDLQVAYWEHRCVSWFVGDNYKVVANSDCDKELLIVFCLIMDNYDNDDNKKSSLNFDLGSLGWGLRKIDSQWQPK